MVYRVDFFLSLFFLITMSNKDVGIDREGLVKHLESIIKTQSRTVCRIIFFKITSMSGWSCMYVAWQSLRTVENPKQISVLNKSVFPLIYQLHAVELVCSE